ncbi:flagellar export chaperone FlgN [Roseimaritima ulvae]|uniref:FlgN protein n=1 Tax=Roseimaritima ulvae TaxID=980254 RepID=A0A5B9QZ75_9BACT|nr:flagellar export chaperone FlgN [Roseimaritima ulvae]QEG42725.1 FlgN protein [Roseimaritima ulvae]
MPADTTKLIQLIAERWQTLQTLLDMSLQQSEMIQQERISELIPLLSSKQPLLQRFADLQEQLRPYAAQPAETRQWADEAQRQTCQQQWDESEEMLAEMMRLEQDCETQLVAGRDRLAERMQQSDGSQRAASAYQAAGQVAPISRLDLSSSR